MGGSGFSTDEGEEDGKASTQAVLAFLGPLGGMSLFPTLVSMAKKSKKKAPINWSFFGGE